MTNENETLRWPTNLDRAGIEKRLADVCKAAKAQGLEHLVALFPDLPAMTAAQIGAKVVAALTWLQDKQDQPERRAIATQLEMVAMNLKNLK